MFGDLNILRIFEMWNNNSEQRNKKSGLPVGLDHKTKTKTKTQKTQRDDYLPIKHQRPKGRKN